ncbi:D-alanyl-D-alanine carboxypeptidase PBP3 [Streptococcus catagoni]|uniref:D-alanyl-D-alanine carboxypeptidase PBP3 n=1 Tax=Streptococcus catagoni TaxID=2654874 RepID=UPI00140C5D83|nr:D-alanyl-D-alanine carboxypeptidase PBP3 [Streptococcus catagoni]
MKRLLVCLFAVLFFSPPTTITYAESFTLPAKGAIAFDLGTGKILYEKDAEKQYPIASLTKVLTTYLVYKEVHSGKLQWDTPVKISNYPYELTTNYSISNVPLDARQYTVKELLNAVLVTNANSPAIALAEKISGTEPLFVDLMKKQLQSWGIKDVQLVNATGLSNTVLGKNIYPKSDSDAENKMSARQLAIITEHLLKEYPEVLEITKKTSSEFAKQNIFSYNYLLEGMPYAREGTNGLSVGISEKGGASLITSSHEKNMDIITIILNAEEGKDKELQHFKIANQLLNYLKRHFEKVRVITKNELIKDTRFPVHDSPQKTVRLAAKNNLDIIQKIGDNNQKAIQFHQTLDPLVAPIKSDKVLGKAIFKDKNVIGSGYLNQPPSVPLKADKDIPKSFFLKVWWNRFVTYVNTKL